MCNFKILASSMKELYYRALSYFIHIRSKIAFYPTVFALLGIFSAFIMMYFEGLGISQYLFEEFPAVMVENGDTALTVLSALITGLISMMVFSFSMVMLLLSQASNNYSPRLLPGLISDKVHQIILGIYLATILYLIFILFSIHPSEDEYGIPGFSVLMGIVATVVCIYAFIYFIHNISQSIQISNILERIFTTARTELNCIIEQEIPEVKPFPSSDSWYEYYAENSGYLQNMALTNILDICERENTLIHILPVKGMFVLKGIPLFKSRKELDDKTVKNILSNFNFGRGELVGENYVLAFKQLTEIIVKAMSPGINDPGTALNGIDYLTELFSLRMEKKDSYAMCRNEKVLMKINTIDFDVLLYNVMGSIRTYCKHDIVLVQKLLLMFQYLKMQNIENKSHLKSIEQEAITLILDARESITTARDLKKIEEMTEKLNLYIH
ncbi:hypothetical protein BH23BAC2_BH23BAC2_07320 [soil metagenome]